MIGANVQYDVDSFREQPTLRNELRAVMEILRRHTRLILLSTTAGLVLATAYSFTVTPTYLATAQLSLDPRRTAIAAPVNAQTMRRDEPLIDSGRADTEVETIRSESVIRSVVTTLDLQNAPEFNLPPSGIRGMLNELLGSFKDPSAPPTEEDRILGTMVAVGNGLKVERVDKSYVITISFEAISPELAAKVANGFADAYVRSQFDANYDATKQAVVWLKARLNQLSDQTAKAEAVVNDFRRSNSIAKADGKLIDEQQLAEISTQLSAATAAKGEAKAKLDRIMQLQTGSPDLSLTDALQNTVITKLRQQYLEINGKASSLASRYGEQHAAVIKMRADAKAILDSIRTEMQRYQESYRSDYEIASARERSLKESLDEQFKKTVDVGGAQVKLNSYESDARTLRTAYEAFMQRYTDALQRQSFPVSEGRLISTAQPPNGKFKPKRGIYMLAGAALGLFGSLGASFYLELGRRRIRTRSEAEAASGAECLGFIPLVNAKPQQGPEAADGRTLPLDYVMRHPFSVAAETLRTVATSINHSSAPGTCPVVGMISCLPDEGKTSISANLAYLLAGQGKRVLLVDADLRNPSLTHTLKANFGPSIEDVLLARANLATSVQHGRQPFDFVPSVTRARPSLTMTGSVVDGSSGFEQFVPLGSDLFGAFIAQARDHYDYVVVDLPPVLPLADVRSAERFITAFVLVLAWAKSEERTVGEAVDSIPNIHDKLAGCVLNMADVKQLARYGEQVATYYNSKYFTQH
ncbi:chain-length determining protein [Alsobacter metallidurans]|uniref:non-specific protein-tyrosine kinase n=1 Tax=Alsobacter metallidurans TaxID=340221 RepID=A0A917I679_9HYPH|nr:AAA family ATPase [Alsobacter metallidurans]GGH17188.1 chain-length determining protein [Alsobacter metallidurans]